jgi:hypothetical protein
LTDNLEEGRGLVMNGIKLFFINSIFGFSLTLLASSSCFPSTSYGLLCNTKKAMGDRETYFFSEYLWTKPKMKESNNNFYSYVDQLLVTELDKNCPSPTDSFEKMLDFLQKHRDFCINKCDDVAKIMKLDPKTFDLTRSECQEICRTDYHDQTYALNGYELCYKAKQAVCGEAVPKPKSVAR